MLAVVTLVLMTLAVMILVLAVLVLMPRKTISTSISSNRRRPHAAQLRMPSDLPHWKRK